MRVLRELLSFSVIGVIGLAVDLGVLYLLAPWLGWYGARVLSFVAAATLTWGLNRSYTFARRDAMPLRREYLSYLTTMLGGAALNYTTYVLVLHWLQHPFAPAIGVALGSCVGLTLNFLSARHLIFKRRGP